ncbi:hypothetical protein M405DRAFT_880404 [Rhizopogon salebrosus TDB-379]|nr:hypothetical protein M405DRAFT_880404 [Rhizopogon salebrosus TDB-379]
MSTSLKAELETWAAALNAYDEQDFDKALELFSRIADSSKILTNIGLIYATIGEHEAAVQQFTAATNLDPYLAIAYFQCGVSNFLLNQYELALQNFEDALLYLRGNQAINYEQIGLKFQLFTPEVLFNKGLSQIYLGYPNEGLAEMEEARKLKVTDEHNVIDDAIADGGEGYTVFSIPVGVLYRPSENKLKNSKSKDYLGKARLVAAADETDAFTEFTGVKKLKEEREKAKERDLENDDGGLKRSATVPPPRIDPIDPIGQANLERSKTTNAPVERMNPFSRPTPPFTSRRTRSDTADAPGMPSNLSRNNTIAVSRSNTTVRIKAPSGAAVSRGPTMRRNEAMPSQAINQPGALFQPPLSLQNPYSEPLPISNQYQQQYQSQPPVRNQYQQLNQNQNQSLRTAYQPPPPGLQPSSPAGPKAPFVLPATRSSPQEPPVARQQPDFYDDYINAYADEPPRSLGTGSLPTPGQDRVALWPQSSAQPSPGVLSSSVGPSIQRMPSRGPTTGLPSQGPPSTDAPRNADIVRNAAGSTSIRRKPTRRPTQRRPRPAYEEEEEGYVSGEYDDPYELMTIRVKLHYQDDVRGMTLTPDTPFEEFVERVTSKFGTAMDGLGLKFKDEDDVRVTLRDSSDYELAIETARHSAKGKAEGKLEMWCTDLRS